MDMAKTCVQRSGNREIKRPEEARVSGYLQRISPSGFFLLLNLSHLLTGRERPVN